MNEGIRSLWFAIDEPVADTVRRLHALGADPEGVILNDKPRTVADLMTAIDVDRAAYPDISLVIVDTLSKLLATMGVDPNSSKDVEPVLTRLVDFFHERNLAAILLYHTGKGGKEYRGSTAIGASVDEILTLRKRGAAEEDDFDDDDTDDGRRLLIQDGRNLRGRVHLTCAGGRYRLFEDTDPPRTRILEALRDHGSIAGPSALAKLAHVRKSAGLQAISSLIQEGSIIEKNGRLMLEVPGSPRFPQGGTTPEPAAGTVAESAAASNGVGSHFGRVGVAETGTDERATIRRVL